MQQQHTAKETTIWDALADMPFAIKSNLQYFSATLMTQAALPAVAAVKYKDEMDYERPEATPYNDQANSEHKHSGCARAGDTYGTFKAEDVDVIDTTERKADSSWQVHPAVILGAAQVYSHFLMKELAKDTLLDEGVISAAAKLLGTPIQYTSKHLRDTELVLAILYADNMGVALKALQSFGHLQHKQKALLSSASTPKEKTDNLNDIGQYVLYFYAANLKEAHPEYKKEKAALMHIAHLDQKERVHLSNTKTHLQKYLLLLQLRKSVNTLWQNPKKNEDVFLATARLRSSINKTIAFMDKHYNSGMPAERTKEPTATPRVTAKHALTVFNRRNTHAAPETQNMNESYQHNSYNKGKTQ